MLLFQIVQGVLFSISLLLTAHFTRSGARHHVGHILLNCLAALTMLTAITLQWNSPLQLVIQAALVLGPYLTALRFQNAIQYAINHADFNRALELARRRAFLLPFRMYRRQVRLFEGLAEIRARAQDEGRPPAQVLAELAHRPGFEPLHEYAAIADLTQRATRRDWPGIVTLFERGLHLPDGLYDAAGRLLLVRAYCELGALEPALAGLEALEPHKGWRMIRSQLHVAWLAVLATGGRREAVDELLKHQLRSMPAPVASSWRARAAWAAGDTIAAQALMVPLLLSGDVPASMREAIQERFLQLRLEPPIRGLTVELALDRIEQLMRADQLLFQNLRRSFTSRPIVGGLLILMLAVFTATWILADPSRSFPSLATVGLLLATQPWRLLTALFIHDGWLPLLLNMMVLIVLGNVVEGIYRRGWTLALFLISGLAANAVAAWIRPEHWLLGASGALLGWFGALFAVYIRARGLIPAPWRSGMLRNGLLILVIEGAIGSLSARISPTSWLVGLLVGLVLGLLVPLRGFEAIARGESPEARAG